MNTENKPKNTVVSVKFTKSFNDKSEFTKYSMISFLSNNTQKIICYYPDKQTLTKVYLGYENATECNSCPMRENSECVAEEYQICPYGIHINAVSMSLESKFAFNKSVFYREMDKPVEKEKKLTSVFIFDEDEKLLSVLIIKGCWLNISTPQLLVPLDYKRQDVIKVSFDDKSQIKEVIHHDNAQFLSELQKAHIEQHSSVFNNLSIDTNMQRMLHAIADNNVICITAIADNEKII
jgi:hypothetical protein